MSLTVDLAPLLKTAPVHLVEPQMSDEQFEEFCVRNRDLRIERTAEGEVIVMSPTGTDTGSKSGELFRQVANWNVDSGEPGTTFDSSTGFSLPNGAQRSPDASWIENTRYDALTDDEKAGFAPVCPDFVAELMSPSDNLADTQAKMAEYIANGARLGLLIDRRNRQVHVYRPGQQVQILDDPAEVSCDPELPGLILRMNRIF